MILPGSDLIENSGLHKRWDKVDRAHLNKQGTLLSLNLFINILRTLMSFPQTGCLTD